MITGPVFDANLISDGHIMWILQPLFRQITEEEYINDNPLDYVAVETVMNCTQSLNNV
jgi:hypothetical protein